MEVDIPFFPISGNIDVPTVDSHGIGFRKGGRLRVTGLELITVVGVDSHSIPLYFPVARNFDVIPGVRAYGRVGDIGGKVFVAVSEEELPCTVQQLIIVAFFKLPGKCISPVIVRHEGSTRIFFIDRYNLHILPVRLVGCFFGHSACC